MNRKAYAVILSSALVFLAFGFLTGCGSSTPPPPPLAITIAATGGTPQSATVNTAFAQRLSAMVTQDGTPVANLTVTFTAPGSSASGTFGGGVNTATTNSSGVATSAVFTANTVAGTYTVTATTSGASSPANFILTNTAGAAATITATGGTPQSATVGTAFGAPLVATVVDSYSNPVSGATVAFQAPTSGASGSFANGTATDTETTNSSGVATTSLTFTANTKAGTYMVTAATAGVAAPADYALTNTAGPPATISATGGTPQSATVNTAFAQPLSATVVDGYSNPVANASVTFTAPASGASGTFANGTATETDPTNASGIATSTTFTANWTTGSYTVTATTGSLAPANFSLTNTAAYYSFYLTGQEAINFGPNFYALAGSVQIDSSGNVLAGEQDYNDAFGLTSPQPSGDAITGGTLTVDSSTGQGLLTLITNNSSLGINGTETLGIQFVNAKHALIIQFDGSATSSGSLDLQTLPSTLNGGYAFTLSGVDPNYNPVAFGGVFSVSGASLTNGVFDVNDAVLNGLIIGAAFSGALSGPDSFGRGTITGITNPVTETPIALSYYVVGPEVMRIIDVDTSDSAVGLAFGQGASAGNFNNASLGTSVLTVAGNPFTVEYGALAEFSTSNTGQDPADFSGVGDVDELDNDLQALAVPISGIYSIASNGYGGLIISNPGGTAGLGDVTFLGIYMTDPNLNLNDPNNTTGGGGALVLEQDPFLPAGTGVVVPQTDTSTANFAGNYAASWQDFNYFALCSDCEFDMVAQGTMVANGALSLTGLVSDPFFTLSTPDATSSGDTFSGTPLADTSNPGRYSMLSSNPTPNPLAYSIDNGSATGTFDLVIYQASGGQLFWLQYDVTDTSVFLGPLEQQGTLIGMPAVTKHAAKTQMKSKK